MYCKQQQQHQNSASMGHHQLSAAQTFSVDDKTTTTTTTAREVSKSCFRNDSKSDFWFHESNNMTNSSTTVVMEEEEAVLFVPQQQQQQPSSHHHAGVVGYYDPDYDQHHQLTTGNGTKLGSSTSVCSLLNNNLSASTMQHNNMINGFKRTNNREGDNLKQPNSRLDRDRDHQTNWLSAHNHQSENPCANNSFYHYQNHKISDELSDGSSTSTPTKAAGIASTALSLFPTTGTTISFDFGQSGNQQVNELYRHSSLPSTLYGASDTHVALNLRAKRGCATHPRSIAERVRRKRISQRMKRLQELFPNLNKQTSTSDMLEMAVNHIKRLQSHLAMLEDTKQKCTCSHSRS